MLHYISTATAHPCHLPPQSHSAYCLLCRFCFSAHFYYRLACLCCQCTCSFISGCCLTENPNCLPLPLRQPNIYTYIYANIDAHAHTYPRPWELHSNMLSMLQHLPCMVTKGDTTAAVTHTHTPNLWSNCQRSTVQHRSTPSSSYTYWLPVCLSACLPQRCVARIHGCYMLVARLINAK